MGQLERLVVAAVALAAVERVLAGDSEIRELWTDAGDDEWLESVHGLRQRLVDAMAAT